MNLIERLRNENEDKSKIQMTQSFNQYSENETKIWRENILNQFNCVFSSCLRSHFVNSLINMSSTSHKGEKTRPYTVDFKLKVVKFAKDNSSHVADGKFEVDRCSILDWKNKKASWKT